MEVGYEQTTVARIRERSGVSNGALFHRFASKEAIAAALYIEAIRSFQEEHWRMLADRPATLREAVHAIVGHQLSWIQDHQDQARFLYDRGNLDWGEEQAQQLVELNRRLVAAYREWLAPFVASGELRTLSTLLFAAIIAGPAHQVAQRWLEGDRTRPLTRFSEDLADAAWAGIATPQALASGTTGLEDEPTAGPGNAALEPSAPAPRPTRVRIELLDDNGQSIGRTETTITAD